MFLRGSPRFVKPDPGHEEDQRLASGAQDVDRQPGRRGRLAEEARQLDAADARRSDLPRGDPAATELLGEKVSRVPDAAT